MPAYTTNSMMGHAALHFFSAQRALAKIEDGIDAALNSQIAMAESSAGLLAVELAKYADGTGWREDL